MKSIQFNFVVRIIRTTFLVAFFYLFSISLTFYNKWLVKRLHFPLTITIMHYAFVFLIAMLLRKLWESYHKEKRIVLPWKEYAKRVFIPAIAGSLDIGLSNWSFMFITVSLYTMTKSTAVVFLLLFALLFKLEKFRLSTIGVVILISFGLFLFTFESTQFNVTGFFIVLLSSFLSGIRWTTIQILMQKESSGLSNPFDAIYHLQPVMALSLVPLAILIEGPAMSSSHQLWLAASWSDVTHSMSKVLLGASLAFMLTVSEYLLVCYTSSLGLAIAGILKEICTLTIASEFGGDKLNALNFIGLVICMSGITLHVVTKALHAPSKAPNKPSQKPLYKNGEEIPMLDIQSSDDEETIFSTNRAKM